MFVQRLFLQTLRKQDSNDFESSKKLFTWYFWKTNRRDHLWTLTSCMWIRGP